MKITLAWWLKNISAFNQSGYAAMGDIEHVGKVLRYDNRVGDGSRE